MHYQYETNKNDNYRCAFHLILLFSLLLQPHSSTFRKVFFFPSLRLSLIFFPSPLFSTFLQFYFCLTKHHPIKNKWCYSSNLSSPAKQKEVSCQRPSTATFRTSNESWYPAIYYYRGQVLSSIPVSSNYTDWAIRLPLALNFLCAFSNFISFNFWELTSRKNNPFSV